MDAFEESGMLESEDSVSFCSRGIDPQFPSIREDNRTRKLLLTLSI